MNGIFYLSGFCTPRDKDFRPCVSVYLGVHFLSFLRIYVRGVEICVGVCTPGYEVSELFVILFQVVISLSCVGWGALS